MGGWGGGGRGRGSPLPSRDFESGRPTLAIESSFGFQGIGQVLHILPAISAEAGAGVRGPRLDIRFRPISLLFFL